MLAGQGLYVPGIWIGMLIYAPHLDLRMFFTLWTRQVMGYSAFQCPHLSGIRPGLHTYMSDRYLRRFITLRTLQDMVIYSSSGVLMGRRWLNCNPMDLLLCKGHLI